MATDEEKLKRLEDILKVANTDLASTKEVAQAIKKVLDTLKDLKEQLNTDIETKAGKDELTASIDALIPTFDDKVGSLERQVSEVRLATQNDIKGATAALTEAIESLRDTIPEVPPLPDLTPYDQKLAELEQRIPSLAPDQLRDLLETLQGEQRLRVDALDGFEEIKKEIKKDTQVRVIGGRAGIQLYVDGGKKGLAQYLNLIAGSGVTLSYNRSNGRNDVTINSSGAGGFTVLPATGTVDDSNTTFTFASAPTLVVVNGTAYRHGKGVTISGTTATLDYPAGVGGDVYGL